LGSSWPSVFQFSTIRSGFSWHSGDFSQYVHHARNIAEGKPYGGIGYIVNPEFASHAPATYPPIFPLFLAPIYAFFGLNLYAMKAAVVACFVLLLGALYLIWRRAAGAGCALVAVVATGLHPFFWAMKDAVLPDFLFALLLCCCGLFIDRLYEKPAGQRSKLMPILAAGTMMWLVYATRTAGIVVAPALILYDLWKCRRLTKFALGACGVFAGLAVLEAFLAHNAGSYLAALVTHPSVLVHTSAAYAYAVYDFCSGGSRAAAKVLAVAMTALAAFGFVRRARAGLGYCEVFLLPYAALLMVWEAGSGIRYLLPVLPFYLFFAIYGAWSLPKARTAVLVALIAALTLTYTARYDGVNWSVAGGFDTEGMEALHRYVLAHTAPADVFLCQSPRVFSLYTGRPASPYQPAADSEAIWRHARRIGVRYVIRNTANAMDNAYLLQVLAAHSADVERVFAAGCFELYAVKRPASPTPADHSNGAGVHLGSGK
jgi:hypothetical protein